MKRLLVILLIIALLLPTAVSAETGPVAYLYTFEAGDALEGDGAEGTVLHFQNDFGGLSFDRDPDPIFTVGFAEYSVDLDHADPVDRHQHIFRNGPFEIAAENDF